MGIFDAFILGFIQGVTEFLPISSSGHLIILPSILGWEQQSLTFDVVLHVGTALVLLFYFKNDFVQILKSFFSDLLSKKPIQNYSLDSKLGFFLFVSCLPAAILGVLFDDFFEGALRDVRYVAVFLLLGSVLMILSEVLAKKKALANTPTFKRSILIGLFQSLALLPGFSRSGSTISGGMIVGLTREYAAKFSFMLATPIVLGAGLFKVSEAITQSSFQEDISITVVGLFSSMLFGYLALDFLMKYLKNNTLKIFIVYRIILAVVLLLLPLIF